MINRILERLEECKDNAGKMMKISDSMEEMDYYYALINAYNEVEEIVQEVAKEYGKDTNVRSRCDTCTHNVADEVPPICYMCSKGIEDNYERKGE